MDIEAWWVTTCVVSKSRTRQDQTTINKVTSKPEISGLVPISYVFLRLFTWDFFFHFKISENTLIITKSYK